MVGSLIYVSELPWSRELADSFFLIDQDTQKSMTPLGEVEKVFPQRGSLCLYRLVKRANFNCSRCTLEKTSKLVAYPKDKWDEALCNGCYGYLQATSEKQGEAPPTS